MLSKIAVCGLALCASLAFVHERMNPGRTAPREYTVVRLRQSFDADGRPVADSSGSPQAVDVLNNLAGEGWELVSTSTDKDSHLVAILTRGGAASERPATVPSPFFPSPARVKRARAEIDVQTIKTAINMYRLRHPTNALPEPDKFPQVLMERGPNGEPAFLDPEKVTDGRLLDPWGNPYVYKKTSATSFEIISYGEDGAPGGTGDGADISSLKEKR